MKGGFAMQYHTIEIDDEVLDYLKRHAEPFKDTPNSVLRRILFGLKKRISSTKKLNKTENNSLVLPRGIPKALSQVLEVIYEVKEFHRSRTEATNIVASRRGTAPQTILDKYCRQLSKKAYEIDELLEEEDLSELSLLLEKKFPDHKDVINSFFQKYRGGKGVSNLIEKGEISGNAISVYRNKASNKYFIFIEDTNDGKALMVTPESTIKALALDLFEESDDTDRNYLLSHDLISEGQIAKYDEFVGKLFAGTNQSPSKKSSIPIPDQRMTEDDLIPYIIEILKRNGGRASKELVDKEMYQEFQTTYEQPWYQEYVSGNTPRWKHRVAWAKERAKHRGLIKWPSESGFGTWELTSHGSSASYDS